MKMMWCSALWDQVNEEWGLDMEEIKGLLSVYIMSLDGVLEMLDGGCYSQ